VTVTATVTGDDSDGNGDFDRDSVEDGDCDGVLVPRPGPGHGSATRLPGCQSSAMESQLTSFAIFYTLTNEYNNFVNSLAAIP